MFKRALIQKQSLTNVPQNWCSEKTCKFHWKTPALESLFNKVEGPQPGN